MKNLRTMAVVYGVNVSQSSGAGSPGLSWINGRSTVVVSVLRGVYSDTTQLNSTELN